MPGGLLPGLDTGTESVKSATATVGGLGQMGLGGRPCLVNDRQAQRKFKHAAVCGVHGLYTSTNADRFGAAIVRFVNDPATVAVRGTYTPRAGRGSAADFYYEPQSRLVVVVDLAGEFVTGFRMSVQQITPLSPHGPARWGA